LSGRIAGSRIRFWPRYVDFVTRFSKWLVRLSGKPVSCAITRGTRHATRIECFTTTKSERRLSPDGFLKLPREQEAPLNHDTADHLEWLDLISSVSATLYFFDILSVSDHLRCDDIDSKCLNPEHAFRVSMAKEASSPLNSMLVR